MKIDYPRVHKVKHVGCGNFSKFKPAATGLVTPEVTDNRSRVEHLNGPKTLSLLLLRPTKLNRGSK